MTNIGLYAPLVLLASFVVGYLWVKSGKKIPDFFKKELTKWQTQMK